MSDMQQTLDGDDAQQIEQGCVHNQVQKCHNCEKCDALRDEFQKMIKQLFVNIQVSANSQIIKKVENEQPKIEKSIESANNEILLIQTNSEAIQYKLEYLLDFSKNKTKMQSLLQDDKKSIQKKNALQNTEQCTFTQSIIRFHKFMKRLSQQDISQSEFNAFESNEGKEAPNIKHANFSFLFESMQLDQKQIVQIFQSLVFIEIDLYSEVYNHAITAKKFLRKAPELKEVKILEQLDKILAIAIQKNERIVIMQTVSPQLVGFSPEFVNSENNTQAIYLNAGMRLKLSKNYEIRIIEVKSNNEITEIPKNLIVKLDAQNSGKIEKSIVAGANSYITIQEWINNIAFPPLTIYQQEQDHGEISLNHLLDLPNKINLDVLFDKYGFYFQISSEQEGFYPSLHFEGQLMCIPKEINLALVINNELRVHISSDGGELFDDSEEKSRQIV